MFILFAIVFSFDSKDFFFHLNASKIMDKSYSQCVSLMSTVSLIINDLLGSVNIVSRSSICSKLLLIFFPFGKVTTLTFYDSKIISLRGAWVA